ncbi:MAG TPA: diacylglycerol kinase family protein [Anaerolineaceae bacterium]
MLNDDRAESAQPETNPPENILAAGSPQEASQETIALDKHIRVILNPAAGQDDPSLKAFNRIFREAGYGWDVRLTQQAGDATRLAQEAVQDGVDLVVVYGGDGSIMEAAAAMVGSNIPLGIIPGGTGNVISLALNIPRAATDAAALLVSPDQVVRSVDVGLAGETVFLERIGVGLEATVTQAADRQAKDKYGIFAYIISTIQALAEPDIVKYTLTIDGETIETEGLSCVVANIGDLGVANLSLAPDVDLSDGLLDVFVIRKAGLVSLFSLAASVIGGNENQDKMPRYRGREIQIVAEPAQAVQADGEVIGNSPVWVKVLPQALRVIVPPVARDGTQLNGEAPPDGSTQAEPPG